VKTHLTLALWSLGACTSAQAAATIESGRVPAAHVLERIAGAPAQVRLARGRGAESNGESPRRTAMTERKRQSPRQGEKSSAKAIKVPGGWKLPGDDMVYPYNPLVPPDMVDPVPPPPGRKPTGRKPGK
jgi:hypothetical protein